MSWAAKCYQNSTLMKRHVVFHFKGVSYFYQTKTRLVVQHQGGVAQSSYSQQDLNNDFSLIFFRKRWKKNMWEEETYSPAKSEVLNSANFDILIWFDNKHLMTWHNARVVCQLASKVSPELWCQKKMIDSFRGNFWFSLLVASPPFLLTLLYSLYFLLL